MTWILPLEISFILLSVDTLYVVLNQKRLGRDAYLLLMSIYFLHNNAIITKYRTTFIGLRVEKSRSFGTIFLSFKFIPVYTKHEKSKSTAYCNRLISSGGFS